MGALTLVVGNRAAAEDAVQEALVRAWERSGRGESIDNLPGWVTAVAMNLSRSALRRRRAEARARGRLGRATPSSSPGTYPEDLMDLERAVASLPRRQREVVSCRFYLGLDTAETASALHVSAGTVKTCLFRARRTLASALALDDEPEEADHAQPR